MIPWALNDILGSSQVMQYDLIGGSIVGPYLLVLVVEVETIVRADFSRFSPIMGYQIVYNLHCC